MTYQFVKLELGNNIATMSLDRPEALNALNKAFCLELAHALQELDGRDDVRVIILKSNARIFCAGLDLTEFLGNGLTAKSAFNLQHDGQAICDLANVFERCRKPVIAAIHGKCVGGGLDIAAACDIRFCTEDATFCLKEAAVGIVADVGVLQRLPLIIGQGYTREMAYTARFYSAREVERMNLLNGIYPDQKAMLEGARKLSLEICENPPMAVMATKEVLNYSRDASIEEGMRMAVEKNAILMTSHDVQEAVAAFRERGNRNLPENRTRFDFGLKVRVEPLPPPTFRRNH